MSRGRKPNVVKNVPVKIQMPEDILHALDDLIKDPFLGKPALGKRSELVTQLIREHLKKNGIDPRAKKNT